MFSTLTQRLGSARRACTPALSFSCLPGICQRQSALKSSPHHVCEYLEYNDRWIELAYPGTPYQRHCLMGDKNNPVCLLQVVLPMLTFIFDDFSCSYDLNSLASILADVFEG